MTFRTLYTHEGGVSRARAKCVCVICHVFQRSVYRGDTGIVCHPDLRIVCTSDVCLCSIDRRKACRNGRIGILQNLDVQEHTIEGLIKCFQVKMTTGFTPFTLKILNVICILV